MNTSFDKHAAYLPGGETPDFQILAQLPYGKESFASIAGGADPGMFRRVEPALGSWGLLFIHGGVPGFYVPSSESAMAALMRGPNGDRPEPILMHFRPETLVQTGFESGRAKDPAGFLGAVTRFFGFGGKDRFVVSWNVADGSVLSLDFYPMADSPAFTEAYRNLAWYRDVN